MLSSGDSQFVTLSYWWILIWLFFLFFCLHVLGRNKSNWRSYFFKGKGINHQPPIHLYIKIYRLFCKGTTQGCCLRDLRYTVSQLVYDPARLNGELAHSFGCIVFIKLSLRKLLFFVWLCFGRWGFSVGFMLRLCYKKMGETACSLSFLQSLNSKKRISTKIIGQTERG